MVKGSVQLLTIQYSWDPRVVYLAKKFCRKTASWIIQFVFKAWSFPLGKDNAWTWLANYLCGYNLWYTPCFIKWVPTWLWYRTLLTSQQVPSGPCRVSPHLHSQKQAPIWILSSQVCFACFRILYKWHHIVYNFCDQPLPCNIICIVWIWTLFLFLLNRIPLFMHLFMKDIWTASSLELIQVKLV